MVVGDPVRLRQVLLNLISNAVKFTERGQVQLRVFPLTQRTSAGRPVFRFEVGDSGIGLPPDALDRIFLPFEQGDSSTTRRFGGTGLGLPISARLVEMMGGKLGVTSEEGAGSVFHFEVPLEVVEAAPPLPRSLYGRRACLLGGDAEACAELRRQLAAVGVEGEYTPSVESATAGARPDLFIVDASLRPTVQGLLTGGVPVLWMTSYAAAEVTELRGADGLLFVPAMPWNLIEAVQRALGDRATPVVAAPATPKRRVFRGVRVLVAEDNVVNQKVIQVMLRNLGCESEVRDNGRLALESWKAKEYDIVVLDCFMPEMDGISAARAIRDIEHLTGRKRSPIIALTANAFEQQRQDCLAAGMDEFLTKPVALASLEAALGKFIARDDEMHAGATV